MNLRTCFLTRKKLPKSELIRFCITKDQEILITDAYIGHGFYLSKDPALILKVIKQDLISKRFKIKVSDQLYQKLLTYVE